MFEHIYTFKQKRDQLNSTLAEGDVNVSVPPKPQI